MGRRGAWPCTASLYSSCSSWARARWHPERGSGACPQVTISQFLVNYSGYHHGLEGYLVLILIGWVLLFFGIGCLGFIKLNYMKR